MKKESREKEGSEAFRGSVETAGAMLDAAGESFGLIDSDGIILAANETFARGFGEERGRIRGACLYTVLPAALGEHRRLQVRDVIDSRRPLRFSDEHGGRCLEHSLYPVFDDAGTFLRIVVHSRDITERKRSEDALRRSEALLKSIFQAVPVGIGLVYNRILGWTNDQVSRMIGYANDELVGKSARILYDSDDEFERVGREKYVLVLRGGTGVIETQWRRRDGGTLDILLSSKAVDPSDISAGVVFTALDITERKRAEHALQHYQDELEQRVQERTSELMVANQALILEIEERGRAEKALQDSERQLSDIIEFLPDATFVIDRDGRVIAWNKAMETMTGIPAKEMLGKGNCEYAIPFYGKRRPMLIDLVLSMDEEFAKQYDLVQKRDGALVGESYMPDWRGRGHVVYLSGTAAPLYDFRGNIAGAVESIRDSSERRKAEQDLLQTSERLSVVLESLPIITFTASGEGDGSITYITGTVEEITGFRPDEFIRDPAFFFDHVHPDDRYSVRSCRLSIGRKGMCGCEFRFRTESGSYRWFSEFCRLTRNPGAAAYHMVGMWQDVTEEKRILQESNTHLQQAIQSHKLASLGEVVAGVVHEINNPNSFIAYNIPLLEQMWKLCEPVLSEHAAASPDWGRRGVRFEELRSDMAEIINAFRIGSDRINRVVSNLKDFARAEEGVLAKPVSVNEVIEKTLMIVGAHIRRSVSSLDLELAGDLPQVQGHFQKLEQVMANLLVNAHQAVRDRKKGRIRVATRHIPRLGAVVISVEDNGNGMTRSVLDRLFDPFFTTRRDSGGTGLGLSVSYGLIREHQGSIGVLSRPALGSRFTVFIPVNQDAQLSLRPLVLPLESNPDRLNELRVEVGGIDDGLAGELHDAGLPVGRLAEYLTLHPEVDIVLLTDSTNRIDGHAVFRMLRQTFPLITTIAWGGDFEGAGGAEPDILVTGPWDLKKIKGLVDGVSRQRF